MGTNFYSSHTYDSFLFDTQQLNKYEDLLKEKNQEIEALKEKLKRSKNT